MFIPILCPESWCSKFLSQYRQPIGRLAVAKGERGACFRRLDGVNIRICQAPNSIWIPWLQQHLLICGIDTQTPEMPESWRLDYSLWRQTFEKYDVNSETILVGHSCGGGFLIQWMSENPQICAGDVYLVAPAFVDKFNPEAPYDEPLRGGMADDTFPELFETILRNRK